MAPAPSGGGGAMPFPEPPKGDPGAIAACASTLQRAAGELEHAVSGLHGANGSLQSDWQGFAAQAYHAASSGLAAVTRGGTETFRECARSTFELMATRFPPESIPDVLLPRGLHGALARLAYGLTALAEEDPEPEALLSPIDLDSLIGQYELAEWVAQCRASNPDFAGDAS